MYHAMVSLKLLQGRWLKSYVEDCNLCTWQSKILYCHIHEHEHVHVHCNW